jgi:hypothetical protein
VLTRTLASLLCISSLAIVAPAAAQQPRGHAIPPQMVIDDLRESYAGIIAEEVEVRYRAPQAPVRTEMFTVRMAPGDDPGRGPARLRLELGPLRIVYAGGQMTAVSQSAPEFYFRQRYEGPISPSLLARTLPPLPVPQLALAAGNDVAFSAPSVYTPSVGWVSASLDADARPALMTMIGTGPGGNVEIIANADTARLMRVLLQVRAAGAEAAMELSMRPVDPGDPEQWLIDTAGRTPVSSLSQLRPQVRTGPLTPGRDVPDIGFTASDNTRWSLYSALRASGAAAAPGREPAPVALILFRLPIGEEETRAQLRQAAAALQAVRAQQQSGRVFDVAVAGVTQLGDFNPDRVGAARAAWNNMQTGAGSTDLLLGYSSSQNLDLFDPDAWAALVLIGGDRRLQRVVRIDGLDQRQIAEQLRE